LNDGCIFVQLHVPMSINMIEQVGVFTDNDTVQQGRVAVPSTYTEHAHHEMVCVSFCPR